MSELIWETVDLDAPYPETVYRAAGVEMRVPDRVLPPGP